MRQAVLSRLASGAGFVLLYALGIACASLALPAAAMDRSREIEDRRRLVSTLTEALLQNPQDVDLWTRLARLQERRGFDQEAREAYGRALALAPGRSDLRNELAAHQLRRYQRTLRGEILEEATRENRALLALDPGNADALRRALRLALYESRSEALDSLCAAWRAADPASGWPDLVLGARFTESGAWRRACEAYRAGFARLPAAERRAFETLAAVDPLAEENRLAAPDSARFWEDYWGWRDPTPAEPENPRLLEHYRRVVLAELYFGAEAGSLPGWDHAPGRALVRYGLPEDFSFRKDVIRAEEYRVSNTFTAPALEVRYGERDEPLIFTFVDYTLSGRFLNPIEGRPRDEDLFMVGTPSTYVPPFAAAQSDQELEVWRFRDPDGPGRIEVVAALAPGAWPAEILNAPHRLAGKVALYDQRWRLLDAAVASWAQFERDSLGRLIGIFTVDAVADSAIVGLETLDRADQARGAGFATLPAQEARGDGPTLSDIAFLTRVAFDGPQGRYRRAYGGGLPNPGHRYPMGAPLGIGFEAYGLTLGADGAHRARVRVSVGQPSPKGWVRVLLRMGRGTPQAELSFEVSDPGSRIEQLLSVDIPPLEPGRYELRVDIEDLLGGDSTSRVAPFTVLAPGKRR